jgi:hypothetical protein
MSFLSESSGSRPRTTPCGGGGVCVGLEKAKGLEAVGNYSYSQGCGSGSGLDPHSIGLVDPDFFSAVIFYLFLVIKALDPDWIRIWIGVHPKMLDPDPDEMNADQQPWLSLTCEEAEGVCVGLGEP